MEESGPVPEPGRADPPNEEVAWQQRLEASRDAMAGLRHDTARVSAAIAATELEVAGTLRRLAADDRNRGRTAVADRREALARDAEQFAAREAAAGAEPPGAAARRAESGPAAEQGPVAL
jgi:hypothetical protein